MSAHEVTYYQVKCDCCGYIEEVYDDYSAAGSYEQARDDASSCAGWQIIDDQDFCLQCWAWPGDMPDFSGRKAWTGTDDPIRKHAVHPKESE